MLYKRRILQPGINDIFSTKTLETYCLHRGHEKPEYAQHGQVNYEGNAEAFLFRETCLTEEIDNEKLKSNAKRP